MPYKIIVAAIFIIGISIFLAWQIFGYKTPEPTYTVLESDGSIEIRKYPALLVAEVKVQGERYAAIKKGFKLLADFIFGNNSTKGKIAMTAPVIQQGTRIAMTAPVIQQETTNGWTIRFVMPDSYTKDTLPKPNNNDIKIISIPSSNYAVIRFRGRNTDSNIQDHLALLSKYVEKKHLHITGSPILAFYNPPWILPFLRRNEILLELKS